MSTNEVRAILERTERYLTETLLPFWIERSPDPEHGGFLSYFDCQGRATGETTKTLLMQLRLLYTMSAAHRAGYGDGQCLELARAGADFLLEHYWDEEHGGWIWIADRDGRPTVTAKVGYGQCFGMYAFGEYFLASGDPRGREAMLRTHAAVAEKMADREHGGYFEIMERDWRPAKPGRFGGDRKSFDVHMHMMEALTTVFEVTGEEPHREELLGVIELLRGRMFDPRTGAGLMQFARDFRPLPPIRFAVEWGSDEEPEGETFPPDNTCYGHNVEFAWLLLRAADVAGIPRASCAELVLKIADHSLEHGIDPEYGGVYIDGPLAGPASNRHKQFWQQAEVLIGMLDAFALSGEERYWNGFRGVHDFVFTKFVNWQGGGEWFALLDRDGTPLWDYQGHAWKISYHTVRSMIEVVKRLRALRESGLPGTN